MSRLFGWDLPPGCTSGDIERAMGGDERCAVCGLDADACICPECPKCGEVGRIACYAITKDEFPELRPRMARPGERIRKRSVLQQLRFGGSATEEEWVDAWGSVVQPYDEKKDNHRLTMTREQVVQRMKMRIEDLQNQIDNERQAIEWVEGIDNATLIPVAGAEVLRMRREK